MKGGSLTLEQKWDLIGSEYERVNKQQTIKTCAPDFIGGLYINVPFPSFNDGRTMIQTDENNIFDGRLTYAGMVTMTWKGYASQLYDGELKVSPVSSETSFIEGVCDGKNFKFVGTRLEYGVWPGFLLIYTNKQ